MKFLVDAHLPRRMVRWLVADGCDAIHTFELSSANRTPDRELAATADRDERILITKDGDFVDSHLLLHQPTKLLLVTTGNISNRQLEQLVVPLISRIVAEFQNNSFVELGVSGIIIRG
jgi:predicted nuclease of predicted toxin-antitoxin system